jgi:hypothetical protein
MAFVAQAQTPVEHRLDREEFKLLMANSSAKGMDIISTHYAHSRGLVEAILPDAIAYHPARFVAYDAGVMAIEWTVARRLNQRHPKLTHVLTQIDLGGTTACVANNFVLPSLKGAKNDHYDRVKTGSR